MFIVYKDYKYCIVFYFTCQRDIYFSTYLLVQKLCLNLLHPDIISQSMIRQQQLNVPYLYSNNINNNNKNNNNTYNIFTVQDTQHIKFCCWPVTYYMYSWGFDNVQSIIIRFIFPLYSKSVIDHFISGLNYPYQLTGDGASHRVQHTIITGILYFSWRTTKTFAQVNCLTSISLTKLKHDLSTVFLKQD